MGPGLGAGEGGEPAGAGGGDLGGGLLGFEAAVEGPVRGDFGLVFPEAGGEAGEEGDAEGGGFGDAGAGNGGLEEVGLELHEEVVGAGAAVDTEFGEGDLGVGGHGGEDVDGLPGDGFEGGAGEVGGGGAAGEAEDRAAGVGIPVRGAEAGKGGDDGDAAGVGNAAGEGFDFGGGFDDSEAVAEPLDEGAGDEDAAFEGVFGFWADFPGDGGDESVLGEDGFFAGVHEDEAAGAVGVFGESGSAAGLAEKGGVLVAGDSGYGNAGEFGRVGNFGKGFAAGTDFGENGAGDLEGGEEFVVPIAGFEIEEEGAGGVGGVGEVGAAAGEFPDEPGVDGAEGDFAAFGALAEAGDLVEEPANFGGGEIGVDDEAGFVAEEIEVAGLADFGAEGGGAAVLPDDGAVDGVAGFSVPEKGGFALVGEADGGNFGGGNFGFGENFAGNVALGVPDVFRIVFDPTGLRKVLGEFALGEGADVAGVIEQEGAGAGGALVEGEDEHLGSMKDDL